MGVSTELTWDWKGLTHLNLIKLQESSELVKDWCGETAAAASLPDYKPPGNCHTKVSMLRKKLCTLETAWCSWYRELTMAAFLLCPLVGGPITWLASPSVHNCRCVRWQHDITHLSYYHLVWQDTGVWDFLANTNNSQASLTSCSDLTQKSCTVLATFLAIVMLSPASILATFSSLQKQQTVSIESCTCCGFSK